LTADPGVAPIFRSIQGHRYQLYTTVTNPKPRVHSLTLNINLTTAGGVAPTLGIIRVALQSTNQTIPYGTGVNLPPDISAAIPAGWELFGLDDGTGWSNPTVPSSISLPLGITGTTTTDPILGTVHYELTDWDYILEDAASNGIINLAFYIDTGAGATGAFMVSPTLTVVETPFHTGMMVGEEQLRRRARVVHSYKSGFPYLSDEAIPDGFTDGIMMHPDDFDPIDPVAQGRGDYVPSPLEGVVDDEVVDLE
jgi:hypothetical protein